MNQTEEFFCLSYICTILDTKNILYRCFIQLCAGILSQICVCFAFRWLKFEEDVEDGGERWSKPYVATLSLHSLFELRSCIMNGTVLLDMRANTIEEIAGRRAQCHV